jgi:hypothetical protein
MQGEIGAAMFEHACKLGVEGIVSKHRDCAKQNLRKSTCFHGRPLWLYLAINQSCSLANASQALHAFKALTCSFFFRALRRLGAVLRAIPKHVGLLRFHIAPINRRPKNGPG